MRPVHESPSLLYLLGRTLTLSLTALGLTVGLGLLLCQLIIFLKWVFLDLDTHSFASER
jgi:hypothetical protein